MSKKWRSGSEAVEMVETWRTLHDEEFKQKLEEGLKILQS